jgi:hypothetical protein
MQTHALGFVAEKMKMVNTAIHKNIFLIMSRKNIHIYICEYADRKVIPTHKEEKKEENANITV